MPFFTLPSVGAACATVATLVLFSALQLSMAFFIFSAIPLITLGLRYPIAALALSIGIASLVLVGLSSTLCLFFLAVIAVPSLFFIARIRQQHPIGWLLSDLAIYAFVLLAAIQLMLADQGGLASLVKSGLDTRQMDAVDPQMAAQLAWLGGNGSFLLVGAGAWWAILLFYAAAWCACKLVDHRFKTHYLPLTQLIPYYPPIELLLGLLLSGILSLIGTESLAFIGKIGFVIILLPYCLSGAMYTPLRKWRGMQTGWMFLVIFLLMVFTWLAVILATIGVWKHTEAVLRRK